MKKLFTLFIFLVIVIFLSAALTAHVSFFEEIDYSQERPFVVRDSIENAKAVFARLEPTSDIDVYTFTVTTPLRLHARAFVPRVAGLEQFLPSLAVVGPELPLTSEKVPFTLPDGYGAVVVNNRNPGEKRPLFYEPFSGKEYYDAPAFDRKISAPGTWYIFYWDPYNMGGDYVAILGFKEEFF
jgi:hypothetical protein